VNASTHYVAEYIDGKGLRIPLVGYDLVPENREWLKKGVIDFLLTQRPVQQGYRAVRYLFRKLVMGEECPEHEYTPIDIVTRENLEYLADEEIQ
jgi:LacI family transcriptional regulator